MSIYNEFCVYITKYRGNKMPPLYVGSRATIDVLKNNYFGTVTSKQYKNIWKEELKLHPELFSIEIISTHVTRQEALDAEEQYQRKVNAVNSEQYINQSYANGKFSNLGKKASDETKQKMREARLGRKFTESHKAALSLANKGKKLGTKLTEETKKKMSEAHTGKHTGDKNNFYGKKHSDETKKKISEAGKGRKHSEETKTRIGASRKLAYANK